MTDPAELHAAIRDEMRQVLIGKDELVKGLTIAILTDGHILLEGVPGVAKTTVANLFAEATGFDYNRIQMTPDILPADITGTSIYREQHGEFELQRGPVFANVVVADEINRATPKTQSALLEAMQERTVSIEGETLDLPDPFIVIATQNPIEMDGTYELPEAQRDRFQLKLTADLPSRDEETELLDRFDREPDLDAGKVSQVVDSDAVQEARQRAAEVYIDDTVKEYVLDIVAATRDSPALDHGASPRASLAFLSTSKARAAIEGREYVIPEDVKALASAILSHRVVLSTDAELSNQTAGDVIEDVIETVEPPGSGFDAESAEAVKAVQDGGLPEDGSESTDDE
ncbi:MoxR family ATPase [Haloarculaceae archaeon H-GB2-1]|nr:MoxR family ATPase [Haloarculaceae archaeon H-GB1-1]MEA5388482.1 MoxR family ATPase [Haloarculaceae archaeon H-GB11]MEA5406517.1 MoxR family ATPase [Haloarculaceae archaeon H-GB2-1]